VVDRDLHGKPYVGRAEFSPEHGVDGATAARLLVAWGNDHALLVRGHALADGVNLGDVDGRDAIGYLYKVYEQDMVFSSTSSYVTKHHQRVAWRKLLGAPGEYQWMENPDDLDDDDNATSASGRKRRTLTYGGEPDDTTSSVPEQSSKGYVPPTESSEAALTAAGLDPPLS
jgi:hypothetical protein